MKKYIAIDFACIKHGSDEDNDVCGERMRRDGPHFSSDTVCTRRRGHEGLHVSVCDRHSAFATWGEVEFNEPDESRTTEQRERIVMLAEKLFVEAMASRPTHDFRSEVVAAECFEAATAFSKIRDAILGRQRITNAIVGRGKP